MRSCLLKSKLQNFLCAFDKGKNLGLRKLILRYPTSFMINLVKWHPFVLFKKIPDCNIPKKMNKYKVKTCRKIIKGTNKLLGVIEAKNILSLVYIPDHLKTKEMSKRAFEEDHTCWTLSQTILRLQRCVKELLMLIHGHLNLSP